MNILTVEYEGLRPMNEFGYWHYHTDQKGLPDGGMSISVELLNKYAADKVREALDRVQHVRDHKPESEWSSFGLSADMWDEIEAIRKELQ